MCQVRCSILYIHYLFNHHNNVRERFSHSLPPHFTDVETEVQRTWCDHLNCSLRFFYSLLLSQAAETWQLAATPLPLDLIGFENGER